MDKEKRDEVVQEILEGIPDRFLIVEEEIDPFTHKEYYHYVSKIDVGQYVESDILLEGEKLGDSTVPLAVKKRIIAILAQIGTVKAYRVIERNVEQAEGELKHWSRAGLHHCRMRLESSLGDSRVGMISTALGGRDHRLRYIVVIGFLNPDLHPEQKRIIEESFQHACCHHDSVVEDVHLNNSYVTVSLLVSIDIAVGTLIEESIHAANERTYCLYEGYYVTNVKQPTEEEINRYLKDLREKE